MKNKKQKQKSEKSIDSVRTLGRIDQIKAQQRKEKVNRAISIFIVGMLFGAILSLLAVIYAPKLQKITVELFGGTVEAKEPQLVKIVPKKCAKSEPKEKEIEPEVKEKKAFLLKEQEETKREIIRVAKQHGATDKTANLLVRIAMAESSLNRHAKSDKSTAKGLFQFTKSTWLDGLKMTGHSKDWTLDDRENLEKSVRMVMFFKSKGQLSRWDESKSKWDNK